MSNRKVSTDALETLGQVIDESQKRDAIHLAVEPVVAGTALDPGTRVDLEGGVALPARNGKGLGIVDPFLRGPVRKGQRFWLVLHPRMVTSLRHVWSHPAFKDEGPADNASAIAVIQRTAEEAGITYETMLEYANTFVECGYYQSQGDRWDGMSVGDEFWDAYEAVTGCKVSEGDRGGIFSCSC